MGSFYKEFALLSSGGMKKKLNAVKLKEMRLEKQNKDT